MHGEESRTLKFLNNPVLSAINAPVAVKDSRHKIVFCNEVSFQTFVKDACNRQALKNALAKADTDEVYHEIISKYIGDIHMDFLKMDLEVQLSKAKSIKQFNMNVLEETFNVVVTKQFMSQESCSYISSFYLLSEKPVSMISRNIMINDYYYPVTLTPIQYACLILKSFGLSNSQVGKKIYRSESTIRSITQKLFELFDVYDYFTLNRYCELSNWFDYKIFTYIFGGACLADIRQTV
ncbi:hypothetical protein [Facilibium subflavum]|uniref:hypothetical protein n=1 Tax=Facilibium subflavum TaxID=2219058 RepID=UPI000E64E233|nr:hypothetical protein [Facilibium subflavum]